MMAETNYKLDIINGGGGQLETLLLQGIHMGNNFKMDQDDSSLQCIRKK
jgi:hypothetical protein